MKRLLRAALLAALAAAALGVTALAADTGGMYDVTVESGYTDTVTLTPQTADGTTPEPGSITVDETTYNDFYADAEKIQVTYIGSEGSQYLVLALDDATGVPTEDNIVYIDQQAADSTGVTFTVYPSSLVSGTTYGIYLSGSGGEDGMALTQVASFQYYMPYTLGDVDESGRIDINDAMAVINHILFKDVLSGNKLLAADTTGDGSVNINDAMEIINYIVGKPQYLV